MRIIILAALLTGCVAPHLHVMRYTDHVLIEAWPPNLIDDFCSSEDGIWDDGTPKHKGDPVGGCTEVRPTIWVKRRAYIPHEDRHRDCMANHAPGCGSNGFGDPDKEGYR